MKHTFTVVAVVVYLSWLIGTMAARQYLTLQRPEVPRPESNWTVAALVNYGKVVYVTPAESRLLYFTNWWFGALLFAVCGYAAVYLEPKKRPFKGGAA